ncbi:methanogenesis marker 17 protein [Methanosarcinaceae archaeon]|jgi:putative methanogenesis marker protein 17|nr:methanogenesis marker 17 protein [Methanosarcinaceae archaeon]MBQ3620145.1 methanogenesis marker 17 protein [Methanosarcinaceae archaeon]
MEALEIFRVESTRESEAEIYRSIISDVISDLRLSGAIGRLRAVVIPEESRFALAVNLRDAESAITVGDTCTLDTTFENGHEIVRLSIEREKYMPELTTYLWDTYGRTKVDQINRWTIHVIVENAKAELETIRSHVIANPFLSLHSNMIELAVRSVPEGFRVRYHSLEGSDFIFAASEEMLEPAWIEECRKMAADLKTEEITAAGREKDKKPEKAEKMKEV